MAKQHKPKMFIEIRNHFLKAKPPTGLTYRTVPGCMDVGLRINRRPEQGVHLSYLQALPRRNRDSDLGYYGSKTEVGHICRIHGIRFTDKPEP